MIIKVNKIEIFDNHKIIIILQQKMFIFLQRISYNPCKISDGKSPRSYSKLYF